MGYTRRTADEQTGVEYWGGTYAGADAEYSATTSDGEPVDRWIQATIPLWEATPCDSATDTTCIDNEYLPMTNAAGEQLVETGFFAPLNITITTPRKRTGQANAAAHDSATATSSAATLGSESEVTQDDDLYWAMLLDQELSQQREKLVVNVDPHSPKQAVVNRSFLNVLNISENEALGQTFEVTFTVPGELLDDSEALLQSAATEHTIAAVVASDQAPFFYVPFYDLRSLGISRLSQLTVVLNDQSAMDSVRQTIEVMGFSTHSVADTIEQINSLFAVLRTALAVIGGSALAVAALGMFNTLTVSLLERTREIGLMKALGLTSGEVQKLFLTESIIMGFLGGVLGVIFAAILGSFLSFGLSIFTIVRGADAVNVTTIPGTLIFLVLSISLLVGLVTGIYPAARAKKISALDALRYE